MLSYAVPLPLPKPVPVPKRGQLNSSPPQVAFPARQGQRDRARPGGTSPRPASGGAGGVLATRCPPGAAAWRGERSAKAAESGGERGLGGSGGSPAAGTALPESRKPRGRGRRGQGKRSPRPQPGGCQSCLAAGSFPKYAAETLRGAAGTGAGPCTSPPANTRPQSPSTVTPRWGLSAPSLRGHCELSGPGEVAREAGSIPATEPAAAGRTGMRCPSCGGTHSNCPLVVPKVPPVPPAPGSSSVLLLAIQNCCHHGVKDTTGVAIVTA